MATPSGQQGSDLKFEAVRKMLENEPYRVHFFQAVRLLERLYPERHPVGLFVTPDSEVVRFSSVPTLSFPASEIQSFDRGDDGQSELAVNFMGLSAAVGALPNAYTEFLLERARAKDHAAAEFFDLFNHRVISLFYRAWQKYRFYVAYERGGEGDDAVTSTLYHLLGLGTKGLRDRMEIADDACLYYAGILAHTTRTSQGLKQILEDYFAVPVSIEEFTGSWNRLPPTNQTFLRETQTFSERLGMGTIVGDEVWDQHGAITIRLGPMKFDRYEQFLPGGTAHRELRSWLRFYTNREFDSVVQLVLERAETPGTELGDLGKHAARLGLVSWIKNRPLERDPDEATYRMN
jgi:type VI secretion system protein ImpH